MMNNGALVVTALEIALVSFIHNFMFHYKAHSRSKSPDAINSHVTKVHPVGYQINKF